MSVGRNKNQLTLEIVTLFPGYFNSPLNESIIKRAKENSLFDIKIVNLRDFGLGKHRTVDDTPCGGGGGMVLALEPLVNCLESLGYKSGESPAGRKLLLMSAAGKSFTQKQAVSLSLAGHVTIICGHYLGVDERLLELFEIEEISIGDFVLTGGEPAAVTLIDALVRLLPGALGDFSSAQADSHQEGILGPPVYTRPENFRGKEVPPELISGDHKKIADYRRASALQKTAKIRPDLLRIPEIANEMTEEEKQKFITNESENNKP